MTAPPPTSTLFPYTTLFRSVPLLRRSRGYASGQRDCGSRPPSPNSWRYGRPASYFPEFGEGGRSEEHTSELQSLRHLVCRLLLEKKKKTHRSETHADD